MARGNKGSAVTDADQQMLEKREGGEGAETVRQKEGRHEERIGSGKHFRRRGVAREGQD